MSGRSAPLLLVLLVLALSAGCGSSAPDAPTPAPTAVVRRPPVRPGAISGVALYASGKPLQGVTITATAESSGKAGEGGEATVGPAYTA